MRRMIMEPEVIVQNGKVGMVQLEQMLQRARGLVGRRLDVVHLDAGDVDSVGRGGAATAGEG